MEYFRDPKNQIYADLAYRMGKIVIEYEKISVVEEKYEATLYIAVLQNLMTNCNEHVRQMTSSNRNDSIFKKDIEFARWGLKKNCWLKNTFNEELNLQNFIARMRNSISHPTILNILSEYPSTGFTTLSDNSGVINKFRFINSPDTTKNRIKSFQSPELITEYIKRNIAEFPKDITFTAKENTYESKYFLTLHSQDFARISIIDLSVVELGSFVKNLANYLAQPIQKNWDGVSIKELLAA